MENPSVPKTGEEFMKEQAAVAPLDNKTLMLTGLMMVGNIGRGARDAVGVNGVMRMTAAMIWNRIPASERPKQPDKVLTRFMGTIGLQNLWCWKWAKFGFPTVHLTSEQVAAFALSDVPAEVAAELKLPWPVFVVQVPSGALSTGKVEARRIAFTWLDVTEKEEASIRGRFSPDVGVLRVHLRVDLSDGTMLWATNKNMADFENTVTRDTFSLLEMTQADDKLLALSKNLVLNVLVAINNKDGAFEHRRRKIRVPRVAKKVTVLASDFVVGTPVVISHIKTVRDYLSGVSDRVYTARWLVRGHWRNQPCGTGRSERKHIFIEPHWKGPESGPTRVKTYEFDGEGR
jgi:hypothetical protein